MDDREEEAYKKGGGRNALSVPSLPPPRAPGHTAPSLSSLAARLCRTPRRVGIPTVHPRPCAAAGGDKLAGVVSDAKELERVEHEIKTIFDEYELPHEQEEAAKVVLPPDPAPARAHGTPARARVPRLATIARLHTRLSPRLPQVVMKADFVAKNPPKKVTKRRSSHRSFTLHSSHSAAPKKPKAAPPPKGSKTSSTKSATAA